MEHYCAYCMTPRKGTFCGRCGHKVEDYTPLPHHLQPGTLLHGTYLLGGVLGEGGFGITYIGLEQPSGRKVAVKEYYPYGLVNRNNAVSTTVSANPGESQLSFEKGRERFLLESTILAKFSDESGIVSAWDFFLENNTAYIVMEYLEGVTLRSYMDAHGKLTCDAALRMLQPVMKSLEKVHTQGLIHRDISPDNIMLLNNGQVKLLDFGSARNVTGINEHSLSVILKPGYTPEEQYRTRGKQGPWTDVYALSATIYCCITGQRPDDALNRVFCDELVPPSSLGAVITPAQEVALLKGLAVLQKNRYQSIGALLQGFSDTSSVRAPVLPPPPPVASPKKRRDSRVHITHEDSSTGNFFSSPGDLAQDSAVSSTPTEVSEHE